MSEEADTPAEYYWEHRPPMQGEVAAMLYLDKQWHELSDGEKDLLYEFARLQRQEQRAKDFFREFKKS